MLNIDNIIEETISEYLDETKEICSESRFPFYGEFEAMYFSNLRRNLQSDLAHIVIHSDQCLADLAILRKIRAL